MSRQLKKGTGSGLLLALLAAGCGTGTSSPPPRALSASTHGLSYTLRVTSNGKEQCATASYRIAPPKGQPTLQGSHLCGAPAQPGHVVLVQAHKSAQAMLTDVSAGCGAVQGGSTHSTLRRLVTRCTTGQPTFRVTILPAARRLVIVGVKGVPVINFPRHACRTGICITPLT